MNVMNTAMGMGMGLGIVVGIKDMFSREAVRIKAAAGMLDASTAASAAKIDASMRLIKGGLMLAGVGVVALKVGDKLAANFRETDKEFKELIIKGIAGRGYEEIRAKTRKLGSDLGIMPGEMARAAVRATEYGLHDPVEMLEGLKWAGRAAIGTQTAMAASTDNLLTVYKDLGYGLGDLQMLSGKTQLASDALRISWGEVMEQFRGSGGPGIMRAFNMDFDQMLSTLVALKPTGMGIGENLSALRMVMNTLTRDSTPEMAKALNSLGPDAAAAIKDSRIGDLIDMLQRKVAGMSAYERTKFLNPFGSRPGAKIVMQNLVMAADKVAAFKKELATGWQNREMTSFQTRWGETTHQLDTLRVRLRGIGEIIGEMVDKSNRGFVTGMTAFFGRVEDTLWTQKTFLTPIVAASRPLGRLALASGLTAAAFGLARIQMVKWGVQGAGTAGKIGLLGKGFMVAARSALPLMLVMGGVQAAITGVQKAYKTNYMGFGDWTNRAWQKTNLFFQAMGEAWQNMDLGKKVTTIPEELAKDLEKAGNYDFTTGMIRRVAQVRTAIGGLGEGISSVFSDPAHRAVLAAVGRHTKASLQVLMGGKMPDFGLDNMNAMGSAVGTAVGEVLWAMVLNVEIITAAVVDIATMLRIMFGRWMPKEPRLTTSQQESQVTDLIRRTAGSQFSPAMTSGSLGFTPRLVGGITNETIKRRIGGAIAPTEEGEQKKELLIAGAQSALSTSTDPVLIDAMRELIALLKNPTPQDIVLRVNSYLDTHKVAEAWTRHTIGQTVQAGGNR